MSYYGNLYLLHVHTPIYSVQRGLLHAVCSKVDDIRALASMNYEE